MKMRKEDFMTHIPLDAKWYIAEVILLIRVGDGLRNTLHKNTLLVRADSPEEAYQKAVLLGQESEVSYANPEGKQVQITFWGLAELSVVHDELERGAELLYEEKVGLSKEDIEKLVLPQQQLSIFRRARLGDRPDYSSKEIMGQPN
jgi:Domain of unknown function (DUF4288)